MLIVQGKYVTYYSGCLLQHLKSVRGQHVWCSQGCRRSRRAALCTAWMCWQMCLALTERL
jgi:hypothetical protein